MNLDLEQLFDDPIRENDIAKFPSRSRRELLSMLLLAPLATQVLAGCGGNGGGGGGSGTPGQQSLTLSPQNPQVTAGATVPFTVTAPTGITGTLEYDWTQTSAFATLSTTGATGNKLTTTNLTVQLITTPSDNAPITVTVIAYQVTATGRVQVGSATTKVTISTTLAANTMSIVSTDPSVAANNFNQVFPISIDIGDGALPGTWVWILGDMGDPGDYPFQVRITTPVLDELAPPTGSTSLSIAYQQANTLPTWVLLNGNGIYGGSTPLTLTRTPNPGGGYTYNITFSTTNNTQTVSGKATFDVKTFPPS